MRFGLDYAWCRISPAEHRAIGSSFACRYLSNDASKNLTRAEADELRSHGIDVVGVWESTASRALAGRGAGESDARKALVQATDCGMPKGRPIYFAVDFDEAAGQAGEVADYFRGVGDVLGVAATGCYGGYEAVRRLFDAKLIRYGWQTYAWSGCRLDARAQIYQYSNDHAVCHHSCDYDHALKEDFGQWDYIVDPYTRFPTGPFRVTVHGTPMLLNERYVVQHVDGALAQPRKYHTYLTKTLRPELTGLRDRVWIVAHRVDPLPDKPSWGKFSRGWRWQQLNDRMKKIDHLHV